MELILVLLLAFICFKLFIKTIRSIVHFSLNILLIIIFKNLFDTPIYLSVLFMFYFRHAVRYINKKIKLSIKKYKKYRKESDCLRLRKIVRLLFEFNYIILLINYFLFIPKILLEQSFWISIEFIVNSCLLLIIINLIKKSLDLISEKYYT